MTSPAIRLDFSYGHRRFDAEANRVEVYSAPADGEYRRHRVAASEESLRLPFASDGIIKPAVMLR